MSATELLNEPVDVPIGGKTYKMRQLPSLRILSIAGQYIKQGLAENNRLMAEGLDGADKVAFLLEARKTLPVGQELEQKTLELISEGMPNDLCMQLVWESACSVEPVDRANLELRIDQATADEMAGAVEAIGGKADAPTPTT